MPEQLRNRNDAGKANVKHVGSASGFGKKRCQGKQNLLKAHMDVASAKKGLVTENVLQQNMSRWMTTLPLPLPAALECQKRKLMCPRLPPIDD